MTIWLDAQLAPALAQWMQEKFSVEVHALRDLELRDAADTAILDEARKARTIFQQIFLLTLELLNAGKGLVEIS